MTIGWEYDPLVAGAVKWDDLGTLLQDSAKDLGSASTGGLAPGVQGAANSFLTAWQGYAGESAAIAAGMAGALRASVSDVQGTDGEQSGGYSALDSRLGPSR
ncbi:hypothetical protein [Nocardioides houyundeii]|uniref:hypothetical protein n=1 Tax=Nocardioides houyundeii TaxID=2045452 RepID=UPI000C786A31|nr:hypothetical protein [Nocardioides houyundeii]